MLNGVAPLLLFNFKIAVDISSPLQKLPIVNLVPSIKLPTVPLYLDEDLTGLYMDSQSKNIDIDTNMVNPGDPNPVVKQKPIASIITLNMFASKSSIGMILLNLFCEQILDKIITEGYSIDFFNGSTILFGGLLHGFSIVENSNDDRFNISLQLSKGRTANTIQGAVAKVIQPFFGAIPGKP